MFGFVVVFSFLWVVWAISPLSTPLIGEVGNPIPDMALVLCIAGLAVGIAARVHRANLFARRIGSRCGAFIAIIGFALSAYPPFYHSASALLSGPAEAEWFFISPDLFGDLIEAYSLQGLILAAASTAWITTMLLKHSGDSSAQ
jgi:hypothetical protein